MKIAFDIDGTLWKIRIYKTNGTVVGDQVPDFDLIQVLRWFVANGDEVYVWSAGGTQYAQHIVDKLGLSEFVTVITKNITASNHHDIDLTFDDEKVSLARTNVRVRRPDYKKLAAELKEDELSTTTPIT
jgi:hypothetical protein